MSQHFYHTIHSGEPTKIMLGWDVRCQSYIMIIRKSSDKEGAFWSSAHQDLSQLKDLNVLLDVLNRLGIHLPLQMIEEVRADAQNNDDEKQIQHAAIGGFYHREVINEL